MIVAVLGAGNGGQAMAAELAMGGHRVRLYEHPQFERAIAPLLKQPEIELVTTDIARAVAGAEMLFLPVPAFAHETYADLLDPVLESGQLVVLFPGTFGTLYLRHHCTSLRAKDVLLCETHTLPYDCRLEAPGRVRVLWKNRPVLIGVFPAERTQEAIDRLGDAFYEFLPLGDVLEAGLSSLNPVLHLPACIMNTGRIERSRGEFWLYEEGFTPTVCRVTERVDAERVALAKAWGYDVPSLVRELAEHLEPRDLFYEINGAADLVVIKGPTSVLSRYFTEDIPYGLVPWTELGDKVGFDTPLLDSLLALGSAIIDVDARRTGRRLATLGVDAMSPEQLRGFVKRGVI